MVMKSPLLSGPVQETSTSAPATTERGAVSEPLTAVTVTVVLASVEYSAPVAYLTSYSPGCSGARSVTGLPADGYSDPSQVPSGAPAGTIVMKSPLLSGPVQLTSKSEPAGTSAGALTVAVAATTTRVVRASVALLWPVTYLTSYSPGCSGASSVDGLP